MGLDPGDRKSWYLVIDGEGLIVDEGDRVDAGLLARLGRADVELLAPVRHRSRDSQGKLVWQRSREALVETRTKLINSVRGQVKAFGGRLPKCSSASFARRVKDSIPRELEEAVLPLLEVVRNLTEAIRGYDRRIEQEAAKDPVIARLRRIRGAGSSKISKASLTGIGSTVLNAKTKPGFGLEEACVAQRPLE